MQHPEIWEAFRTLRRIQARAPALVRRQGLASVPLSFPQERIWALEQLHPGSTDFNIPYAFRLDGLLDFPALEQSLNALRKRHEVLRTRLRLEGTRPVQEVGPADPLSFPLVDLCSYSESEREAKLEKLIQAEAERRFDLERGPLMRWEVLRLDEQRHYLLITLHHIVYDAWSDAILFRELEALYRTYRQGQTPELPELPVQYADFTAWQRDWLEGEVMEQLLDYWRGQLADLRPQRFPADYPRPLVPSGELGRKYEPLPQTLADGLRELSVAEGVTLFITLLAAFNVLVRAYVDSDDVYISSLVANRNRSEVQKLIGYCVNLVVYRTHLPGDPSFRDLLAAVRTTSAGAYAHQEMPIQHLVAELGLADLPLVQVIFSLHNIQRHDYSLDGLEVTQLEELRGVDFDLFLEMEEEQGRLRANLCYNLDCFEPATAELILERYLALLERVVADPARPLSELLPLSDAQRQRLAEMRTIEELAVPAAATEFVPPRDDRERRLAEIWQELLGLEQVGVNANFFALGGKSLLAMQLFARVEEEFGRKLPLSLLAKAPTIEQLARSIRHAGQGEDAPGLVALQPQGAETPLFFLSPAASTAFHYAGVAPYFAPDRPVYVLEQRGMDGKQAPHDSVVEMAADYIREIKTVQPHGPYYIIGRCMGGIVAYEIGLQLQEAGEEIGMIGILDTQSPPRLENRDLAYYAREVVVRIRYRLSNPQLFLDFFVSKFRSAKRRISKDIQDQVILRVLDVHADARKRYRPARLFRGRLDFFKNVEASMLSQAKWELLATEGLDVHVSQGDHMTMLEEPNVKGYVERLKARLERTPDTKG